ncbi:hypothetical protein DL96DRAFT_835928 [Flagelloscypha sp. PMI_526]|nr:hypothetical protein DL96DRAFT_835928 [Flagelloscypha sp. PMI_526]
MDFASFVDSHYPTLRSQKPSDGRRAIKLRLLDAFWSQPNLGGTELQNVDALSEITRHNHPDPFDFPEDEEPMGVLVRTDYEDEESWQSFLDGVRRAEEELLSELKQSNADEDVAMDDASGSSQAAPGELEEEEHESSSDDDEVAPKIISVLSDPSTLSGLTNILVLRLLCDASLARAPTKPNDVKALPPHRLTGSVGLRETFSKTPTIWIYDSLSNKDGSLKAINNIGPELYGCAAGDSWRTKGSHLIELQWSITMQGLSFDFGGLDRWDLDERRRNLESNF